MKVAGAIGVMVLAVAVLEAQTGPRVWPRKAVSFALLEDYDKGEDLTEIEADFALFSELEISTWRGSFGWDDYEPGSGAFDFAWLGDFVRLAEARDITLRPYVGYTPPWLSPTGGQDGQSWNDPPTAAAFQRFVAALARELRQYSNVASYEIYNEQNVQRWWEGTPAQYAEVLRAGLAGVRGAAPGTPVLLGGLVFPDREWLETVCEQATARGFSILPVHAYPETWTPSDVTVENYLGGLTAFIDAADRACGRKPIWINETGFATLPGKSERDQAYWWVRAVATFLAAPRVEHIGVYEIKDLAPDRNAIGDAPNYHLGLTQADRTRKLAFYTIDLLTDLLDVRTLSVEDGDLSVEITSGTPTAVHHHLFGRPDGDRILIVWDRSGSPTLRIGVPGARSTVEYDVDGRPLHWDAEARPLQSMALTPGVPRVFRVMR